MDSELDSSFGKIVLFSPPKKQRKKSVEDQEPADHADEKQKTVVLGLDTAQKKSDCYRPSEKPGGSYKCDFDAGANTSVKTSPFFLSYYFWKSAKIIRDSHSNLLCFLNFIM